MLRVCGGEEEQEEVMKESTLFLVKVEISSHDESGKDIHAQGGTTTTTTIEDYKGGGRSNK